jgi:hypothetical protein
MIRVRNAPPTIELTPKNKAQKSMKISQTISVDRDFNEWLSAIPDQDLLDEQQLEKEVSANPHYGDNPEERRRRLAQLRQLTKMLGIIGTGVSIWGWIFPQPYELVIAVLFLCPIVGIALAVRSKGLIQINQRRGDKRPSVASVVIMPAVVLAFRAFADFHLVDWKPALIVALIGGVLLALCIARADESARKWTALLLFMVVAAVPYAYGAVVEADVLFDKNQSQRFESQILGKHRTTGKNPSWNLEISAWGPITEERDVSVARDLYEQMTPGDTICIRLHKGELDLGWFRLERCDGMDSK